MAEITINHVVSGSVTVDGTINGIISSGGGSAPVLETLNVGIDPTQQQTITPSVGVDGWNEVKVPQAMAIAINTDFVIAMGGNAYDTIVSKDYIAVYDSSGRNATRFSKGGGGGSGTDMSDVAFSATGATATVQGSTGHTQFYGMKHLETLIIKGATGMYSGCCMGMNSIKHVDIECETIGIQAFQDEPLQTIILRNATSIGKQAFYNTSNTITDIYIYTNTKCTLGRNVFGPSSTATVHVPASLLSEYQADSGWSAYTLMQIVGDL